MPSLSFSLSLSPLSSLSLSLSLCILCHLSRSLSLSLGAKVKDPSGRYEDKQSSGTSHPSKLWSTYSMCQSSPCRALFTGPLAQNSGQPRAPLPPPHQYNWANALGKKSRSSDERKNGVSCVYCHNSELVWRESGERWVSRR